MVRALGSTFLGDGSSRAAVLLASVLAARALDPAAFAGYLALIAVATIAAALWDAGVSTVVVRAVAGNQVPAAEAMRAGLRLRIVTLPAWLAAAGLGFFVVSREAGTGGAALAVFGAVSLTAGTSVIPLSILRGAMKFGLAAATLAAGRWTTALMVLVVSALHGQETLLIWLAIAHLLGEGVTLVLAMAGTFGLPALRAPAAATEAAISVRLALPYAANGLLNLAYNRLDILLVALLTTTTELATYAPASRIQDALYIVSGTIYVVAVPTLSRALSGGVGRALVLRQLLRFWAIGGFLAVVGSLLVFVSVADLLRFLLGPEYVESALAARIILWSMPLSVVGAPLLAVLVALGRGADTTKAFAAAFATGLVLHLSLDPWMGAPGAAIASLARDGANVLVSAALVRGALRPSSLRSTGGD